MNRRLIWTLLWLIAFLPEVALGQNLIPNGSFETYRNCPRLDNLLKEATPWYNPNEASPDFYHQCFPTAQIELPPRTGQGLARLFLDQGWAEYLAAPLTKPLEAGECYYFEMYMSMKSPSAYLSGSIGAHFSTQPLTSSDKGLLKADPQVLDNQLTTSSKPFQWEKVAGYVRAKGGERFVTIGSFVRLPPFLGFHYLFFDDVSLLPIRLDLGKDTTLCGRKSTYRLNADTPGATGYRWNDGSTAQTLLVTRPGKYWVTVTTPCKIVSDTITVDYLLDFDLGRDTTLCQGRSLILKTPADGQSYRWQDGSSGPTYVVDRAGEYSLTAEQPGCRVTDSIRIRYIPPPQLDLGPDRSPCGAETVTFQPRFTDGQFSWQDPFPEVERTVNSSGVYRATVSNDCATIMDSVEVDYGACGCILYTPEVFTPNDDGHNDDFQPFACGDITLLSLSVFNRWGELLFKTESPPFQWNGRYRGEVCPGGVYGWAIQYQLNERGQVSLERKQGALTLVR